MKDVVLRSLYPEYKKRNRSDLAVLVRDRGEFLRMQLTVGSTARCGSP